MLSCALCEIPLSSSPVEQTGLHFCCHGCSTVFSILSSKNQLENIQQNPVFVQAVQAGIISNPELLESLKKKADTQEAFEKKRWYLEVGGMWCPTCAELVRLVLLQKLGVLRATIDYATDMGVIEYDPMKIAEDDLKNVIASIGYTASDLSLETSKRVPFSLYLKLAVAIFCSLNLMMFAYPIYASYFHDDPGSLGSLFAYLSLAMSLPVLFYSAAPIYKKCVSALQMGLFGMEALVSISVLAAFLLSCWELWKGTNVVYFDSLSVIVVFVLLGKVMEAKAKFSAKDAFLRLSRSLPKKGRKKMQDGNYLFVNVKELKVGDTVAAFCGEKIVLDGIIKKGSGAVDESLMTGEALPKVKNVDDKVIGGTILTSGEIEYVVNEPPQKIALQRIIEMVQGDLAHKNSYVRAADRVVKWFTPSILLISVITWVLVYFFIGFEEAFLRFLSVLLIACPCAIGIAAPLAEGHLMKALSLLGVVVRNRGVLDKLGREDAYFFDKTGVVTQGRFEVVDGLEKLSKKDLNALGAMCAKSNHLIALAIAKKVQAPLSHDFEVKEVIGKGMCAKSSDCTYRLGSYAWMKELFSLKDLSAKGALTEVYLMKEEHLLTKILLGDKIRGEVKDVLEGLKGVEKILLSGDGVSAVMSVKEALGFDAAIFEATPLDKRECVQAYQRDGKVVAMVGDGINDAPSLTAADVGISVVSASDLSIQVSDLLLTTDSLSVIPKARELAVKCRKIVKQNLFWAFIYNGIGVAMAAFGFLNPIFAAGAMVISSLMVVYNAQRVKLKDRWLF